MARAPDTPRSGEPVIHPSAQLHETRLGRFAAIAERCRLRYCSVGAYSYLERDCEAIYADIGRFCAIAAHARINAVVHPMERVTQHKISYRANEYWPHKKLDAGFRRARMERRVTLGHDVWIGHGAILTPGVTIGHGAVVGAGAVVTRDVDPYTVVAGVPARRLRDRFPTAIAERLLALCWWDWDHDRLGAAIEDMAALSAEAFLDKYEGR